MHGAEIDQATGMVTEKQGVRRAIDEAMAYDGPVLIDFNVKQEENVWPMVQAGKGISEMLLGSEDL